MLPLLPILVKTLLMAGGGGAALYCLEAVGHPNVKKSLADRMQLADQNYQQLVQKKIDPLFGSRHREQQLDEFSGAYTPEEADINRRLGLSIANTGIAVLGSLVYPPLLILNGFGLLYLTGPVIYDSLYSLVMEKRLRYRLFAFLSVLANFFAGFYIIGSLIVVVVFLAFKLTARTESYSRKSLAEAFALHRLASVWVIVEGMEIETPFDQLPVGDVIVLGAGQTIPVDGVIVRGMAAIDQHIMTGESLPVEKTIGDSVLAPTLILSGSCKSGLRKPAKPRPPRKSAKF